MADSLSQREQQIQGETDQKHDEVLVVPVPEAVVDEGAVVVEVFYAASANLTVEVGLSLDHLIIWAEIVEIHSLLECLVDYVYEGGITLLEKARIHKGRQEEKDEGKSEKEGPTG